MKTAARFVLAVAAILWLSPPDAQADERVKAVQMILKSEGFFYGSVDGKQDDETVAAIRRFQINRGLKVTGEVDAETWSALSHSSSPSPSPATASRGQRHPVPPAVLDPAAKVEPEIVPARERARSTVKSDREFLEMMETASPSRSPSPSPAPATTSRRAAPEKASERPLPPEQPASWSKAGQIGAEEARRFVERYLRAAEKPEPSSEVSFYAESGVDYFDSGRMERREIARDQQRYYKRWPQRSFTLLGAPKLVETNNNNSSRPDEALITFRISYRLENASGGTVQGKTENAIRVRRTDDGLKIVTIRERKIRE